MFCYLVDTQKCSRNVPQLKTACTSLLLHEADDGKAPTGIDFGNSKHFPSLSDQRRGPSISVLALRRTHGLHHCSATLLQSFSLLSFYRVLVRRALISLTARCPRSCWYAVSKVELQENKRKLKINLYFRNRKEKLLSFYHIFFHLSNT